MGTVLFLIYIGFSLLVAYVGRNLTFGFWGVLGMCLFISPLLTALLIVLLKPKQKEIENI